MSDVEQPDAGQNGGSPLNDSPVIEPNLNAAFGLIRNIDIDREMRNAYLDYAMSVIVARALPDSRDGLKPVQRRILYVMDSTGARASAPYRKSARVVGDVLGKYHPHGDVSVYDAMVRLAQDFSLRYPLVDGQGNFGSVDGDPPAAMRYTEVRLSRVAEELLADLDKETVEWQDNYDGTTQEPTVIPSALPNLLLNGASGIAVGMATNIPPHNLTELSNAVIYLIDKFLDAQQAQPTLLRKEAPLPEIEVTVDDLMHIVSGPDFPTGGIVIGREGIQQAYGTGRGRIVMRGVATIENMKGTRSDRSQIIITELPYQVNKALLVERIAELVRDERIPEISDLRDESDRNGMRVVIELKRSAQPHRVLNRLYKFTALQSSFGVQCLALVDNQPRLLSLKRALVIFIEHRREVIRRRTEFDLRKALARAHILEGLRIALLNLDEVIRIIRGAASAEAAKSELIARLKLSEIQSQAILDMQLRRLAALERQRIEDEYQEIRNQIVYFEDLLAHPEKILGLIKDDTIRLRDKYGDERRTRIAHGERESFDDEELIPDKSVLISLTQRGYIKQTLTEAYRAQGRGGRGANGMSTKGEDEVMFLMSARTHDTILFFSNKGKVYALKSYQIPEGDRTAKGTFLTNLIALSEGERITSALCVPRAIMAAAAEWSEDEEGAEIVAEASAEGVHDEADSESEGDDSSENGDAAEHRSVANPRPTIAMCTVKGKIKRVNLSAFAHIRASGLICMSLAEGDELSYARLTDGKGELIIVTAQGQALRFNEHLVRLMGRTASGVKAMRMKHEGDYIAGMEVVEPNGFLFTVTAMGYGKCTDLREYTAKGRGGSGMRTMAGDLDQTGLLVAVRVLQETDQITVISANGTALRAAVADLAKTGRATRGSRVINLRNNDTVASVARIADVDMPTPPVAVPTPEVVS
ncbi:MAG: DNA gyrase subunit A [Anaerolineae bacterium]|nr:DNA gyrase subunit A [Anaerolineae bacterium]